MRRASPEKAVIEFRGLLCQDPKGGLCDPLEKSKKTPNDDAKTPLSRPIIANLPTYLDFQACRKRADRSRSVGRFRLSAESTVQDARSPLPRFLVPLQLEGTRPAAAASRERSAHESALDHVRNGDR